jgi:alpha-glucosidase
MMLLTLRGTPFIYYGEEIGMVDAPIPAERVVDVAGRDPQRTPMQWSGSRGAGFTTGDPWLPINPETRTVNVEAQRKDPSSMLSLFRGLIRERRDNAVLRRGSYRQLAGPRDVFAYARELDGERRIVLLNFAGRVVRFPLARALGEAPLARVRISTVPDRPTSAKRRRTTLVELVPDEGVLLDVER